MRHPEILEMENNENVWRERHSAPCRSSLLMPSCASVSPKTGRQCEQTSGRLHGATHQAGSRAEKLEFWVDEFELPAQELPRIDDLYALGGLLTEIIARNQREMRQWKRMKALLDAGRSAASITDEELGS